MERDFMGLNIKEPLAAVKEEVNSDGYNKEIGFNKGIQWPFLNRVSALPHLTSIKGAHEDKTKRVVSDSPGHLSISVPDAFFSGQKQLSELQKPLSNHERQGGNHFPLISYPLQLESRSAHHPHETMLTPVSNYASTISMTHPFFVNHYSTAGQNMGSSATKPQFSGGISVTAPQIILPTIGSVNHVSNPCVKASGSPAQLTIFYDGTVNVYDDVSPEKAQAVMFLAGNGSSISPSMAQPNIQPQAPNSKPAANDVSPIKQPVTTPPCSCLSSPLSVSSPVGAQSGSGSTSSEEITAAKTYAVATTPVSKLDTSKLGTTMGSATMMPSVPQARKASLARFLEKRKERVMSVAAPYNVSKQCPKSSMQNLMDCSPSGK